MPPATSLQVCSDFDWEAVQGERIAILKGVRVVTRNCEQEMARNIDEDKFGKYPHQVKNAYLFTIL